MNQLQLARKRKAFGASSQFYFHPNERFVKSRRRSGDIPNRNRAYRFQIVLRTSPEEISARWQTRWVIAVASNGYQATKSNSVGPSGPCNGRSAFLFWSNEGHSKVSIQKGDCLPAFSRHHTSHYIRYFTFSISAVTGTKQFPIFRLPGFTRNCNANEGGL